MPDNNALHDAAKGGDLVQVQSQVDNFDINAKGKDDETALSKAAGKGHTDIVKLFLTYDADVNMKDVSTFKMKSVHLINISIFHYPSYTSGFLHLSKSIVITLILSYHS